MQTTRAKRLTPDEKAELLCDAFHCLHRKPGTSPFNADELDEWASTVASSGERHAARFVLAVYNQYAEWESGPFNVVQAMNAWDDRNREAFRLWAAQPFTL